MDLIEGGWERCVRRRRRQSHERGHEEGRRFRRGRVGVRPGGFPLSLATALPLLIEILEGGLHPSLPSSAALVDWVVLTLVPRTLNFERSTANPNSRSQLMYT